MKVATNFAVLNLLLGAFHVTRGEDVETKGQCVQGSMDGGDGTCVVEQPQCKFYLAESSIPNAGFGVYTVEAINKDEYLMENPDAPQVMVYDGETHYPLNRLWSMTNYFWSGEGFGQFECASVEEYVVTFGTSCNYHTYLKSVSPEEAPYSDILTPRAEGSPGIGAYSYHGGARFYANRNISAGEEIFADYGEEWLDNRPYLHQIPREADFNKASEIIMKLLDGLDPDDVNDSFLRTVKDVVSIFSKRVSENFIPDTKEEFKDLIKQAIIETNGKAVGAPDIAKQLAFNSLAPRDIEWIKSEGKCLDNLVMKDSTIPHAGKGGFAQRFIAKGETVIIAPLLHIMEGTESTLMYPLEWNEEEGEMVVTSDDAAPIATQLIVNYCYSHDESSMLLCPQTNAININHCSTRNDYGGDCEKANKNEDESLRGPNADIRWATDWDPDTAQWLKMSLKDIWENVEAGKRGLTFEIFATRDIYPGDEVFLDYGEGWEEDWQGHVDLWEAPSSEDYTPISEMNEYEYFFTVDELEDDPYPSNVMTMCHYVMEDGEAYDEEKEDETEEEEWNSDGSDIIGLGYGSISYWPCSVLSRNTDANGETIYEVEIFQNFTPGFEITVWHMKGYRRILQNMTDEVIHFVTKKYKSDQHLNGVFRSPLRIPDEMFPKAWRDFAV